MNTCNSSARAGGDVSALVPFGQPLISTTVKSPRRLTWIRPAAASRLPLSLKLCDRSLFDEAAEYDRDAIESEENRFQKEGEI